MDKQGSKQQIQLFAQYRKIQSSLEEDGFLEHQWRIDPLMVQTKNLGNHPLHT